MEYEYRAWCGWHSKPLEYVTEHEQDDCYDNGWDCESCPYFKDSSDLDSDY